MMGRSLTRGEEDSGPDPQRHLKELAGRIRSLTYRDMVSVSTRLATALGLPISDSLRISSALLVTADDYLK